jgi:Lambda phage tail tube protein, TTP
MSSIAVPGFGTKLANGGTSGASYTNVAQVTDVKLPIGKMKKDDITNFDSPTAGGGAVYNEYIKTMVDAGSVSFGIVFSPTDPTQQAVAANLQNSPTTSLNYWRLTSQDGTTFVFQGYIESEDFDLKFDKAVLGKASIAVSGPIIITWS